MRSSDPGLKCHLKSFSNASLWFIEWHNWTDWKVPPPFKTGSPGVHELHRLCENFWWVKTFKCFSISFSTNTIIETRWCGSMCDSSEKRSYLCNISLLGTWMSVGKSCMIWDKLVLRLPQDDENPLEYSYLNLLITIRCGCYSVNRELCRLLHNVTKSAPSLRGGFQKQFCSSFSLCNTDPFPVERTQSKMCGNWTEMAKNRL